MKKDLLKLSIVIAVLILLGAFFMFAPKANHDFGPVEVEIGAIEVEDQGSLSQVALKVENSEPGFVVVYEAMGEAPGEIIGISDYIDAGMDELSIDLTSTMLPGLDYIVILHVDNGDERFDVQDDKAAMVGGETVRPGFTAQ